MATLRSLTDPDATDARLKALAKVIDPWIEREIGVLLDLARPISDASMVRWLRFISIDHHEDGEASASLLASRTSSAIRFDDHLLIHEMSLD